jgi:hypothetical protein
MNALPDDSLSGLLLQYVGWEISGIESLPKDIRKAYPANGRTTGLPQGTALAPTLANLMLGDVDREAKNSGFAVVRYADDLIFLATSQDTALRSFEWYAAQLNKLGLAVHDPRENTAKAELVDDVANQGLEYLGCFIKPVGDRIHVRPQESKIHLMENKIASIFTSRGRDSFLVRNLKASQATEAWIASYRKLCGMERVAKRLGNIAATHMHQALVDRQIVSQTLSLNEHQRAFLGFRLTRKKLKSRPSRGHTRSSRGT